MSLDHNGNSKNYSESNAEACIQDFGETNRNGRNYDNQTKERDGGNTMGNTENNKTNNIGNDSTGKKTNPNAKDIRDMSFEEFIKSQHLPIHPLLMPMAIMVAAIDETSGDEVKCDHSDNTKNKCRRCQFNPDYDADNVPESDDASNKDPNRFDTGVEDFFNLLFGIKPVEKTEDDNAEKKDENPAPTTMDDEYHGPSTNEILMQIAGALNSIAEDIQISNAQASELTIGQIAEPIRSFSGIEFSGIMDLVEDFVKSQFKRRVRKEMKRLDSGFINEIVTEIARREIQDVLQAHLREYHQEKPNMNKSRSK